MESGSSGDVVSKLTRESNNGASKETEVLGDGGAGRAQRDDDGERSDGSIRKSVVIIWDVFEVEGISNRGESASKKGAGSKLSGSKEMSVAPQSESSSSLVNSPE